MKRLSLYKKLNLYFSALCIVICTLLSLFLLVGCEKGWNEVEIDIEDAIAPNVSIQVEQNGRKLLATNDDETENKNFDVLCDKISCDLIYFFLITSDTLGGVKSFKIIAKSGGLLQTNEDGEKVLKKEFEFSAENLDGVEIGNKYLPYAGFFVLDSENQPMVVYVEVEDYAGNKSTTPIITLIPKKRVSGNLTATRTVVNRGEKTRLDWIVHDTESALLKVSSDYFKQVESEDYHDTETLFNDTEYELIIKNSVSEISLKQKISVRQPPKKPVIITFSANPSSINKDGQSTLRWKPGNIDDIDEFIINPGRHKILKNKRSFKVSPNTTTKYILTAIGKGGTTNKTTEVRVSSPPPPSTNPTTLRLSTTIVSRRISQPFPCGDIKVEYSVEPIKLNGTGGTNVKSTTQYYEQVYSNIHPDISDPHTMLCPTIQSAGAFNRGRWKVSVLVNNGLYSATCVVDLNSTYKTVNFRTDKIFCF